MRRSLPVLRHKRDGVRCPLRDHAVEEVWWSGKAGIWIGMPAFLCLLKLRRSLAGRHSSWATVSLTALHLLEFLLLVRVEIGFDLFFCCLPDLFHLGHAVFIG